MFLRKLKYRSLRQLRKEKNRLRQLCRDQADEAAKLKHERAELAAQKAKVDQELQKAQTLAFKAQRNLVAMEERINTVIRAAAQLQSFDDKSEAISMAVHKMRDRNHATLLQ